MAKRKTPTPASPPTTKKQSGDEAILTLFVQMDGYEEMWRRLNVPAQFTLYGLHRAIQAVTLFTDSHLHQFVDKQRICYVSDRSEDRFGPNETEERMDYETPVGAVLAKKGDNIRYEYDYGDNWQFKIKVEKRLEAAEGDTGRIVCLGGEKAGPVDDCGGLSGFAQMLRALKKSKPDRDDKDLLEWLSGMVEDGYDPDRFDPGEANRDLARIAERANPLHDE